MTMDQKPVSVNGAITTVSGQYEKKEYREESDVFPGVLPVLIAIAVPV